MLKYPDHEIQFLVETLESQRDSAVANAAALFRAVKDLEQQIEELTAKCADAKCDCNEDKSGP